MKKIFILTLISLLLITGSALAFEDFTGEDWNKLNKREKQIFLKGYQEGINITNYVWIKDILEFEDYEETYNYMKNNDRRISVEDERYLLVNKIFEKNPNKSYLELFAKGYMDIAGEDKSNSKEEVFKNDEEVIVKGYDTKLFGEFESDPYYPHSKLYIHFENRTDKKVTGIKYNLKIYDNFGDLIIDNNQKSTIVIEPNKTNHIYFTFSEFMDTKIYNLIANDTLEISVSVNDVVYN